MIKVNNLFVCLLIVHAKKASELSSASNNALDRPIHGGGDVGFGDGQRGLVFGDVLRRELLELHDAPGDVHDSHDEIVDGVEAGFERGGVFNDVRQLFEDGDGLGQGMGGEELRHQPEFSVGDGECSQGQHHLGIPLVVGQHVQDRHCCCVAVTSA